MKNSGVELVLKNIESHPHCPHGPTLLFERYTSDGQKTGRRFYACSACRNRSECNFFHWADDKFTEQHIQYWKMQINLTKSLYFSEEYIKKFQKLREKPVDQRCFCKTCSSLLHLSEKKLHAKHEIIMGITDRQLLKPSSLFMPIQNNKAEAQYFFSESATEFIVNLLKNLGYTRVVCIGTPKIHEFISLEVKELESILLDIDFRYTQFYGKNQFCPYNMFNNHFFDDGVDSKKAIAEFLGFDNGNGIAIVIDPPFGGLIEAIHFSIQQMSALWRKLNKKENDDELPLLWFFPYFNESRILESMPKLIMMDYKVDYSNHKAFHNSRKKQGSPIRIFTNIKPPLFALPSDGYRFCSICDRYVAEENYHCSICNACTTKHGKTYKHCNVCKRCVKPTYEHCKKCAKCVLSHHDCNVVSTRSACFQCGGLGHRKRDCPKKISNHKNGFRKGEACEDLSKETTKLAIRTRRRTKTFHNEKYDNSLLRFQQERQIWKRWILRTHSF